LLEPSSDWQRINVTKSPFTIMSYFYTAVGGCFMFYCRRAARVRLARSVACGLKSDARSRAGLAHIASPRNVMHCFMKGSRPDSKVKLSAFFLLPYINKTM
jgi:hypothetical protein